jgi:CO/xanthine dehydrogenase Mo-binding subunit
MVAEVAVRVSLIKIERMVAVADVGVAVNPDVVTAQIEGAIGFVLSMVLRNQITWKHGLQQSNVGAYLGLTTRPYVSGETDLTSRISKYGDGMLRSYLDEAANVLLTRVDRFCSIVFLKH